MWSCSGWLPARLAVFLALAPRAASLAARCLQCDVRSLHLLHMVLAAHIGGPHHAGLFRLAATSLPCHCCMCGCGGAGFRRGWHLRSPAACIACWDDPTGLLTDGASMLTWPAQCTLHRVECIRWSEQVAISLSEPECAGQVKACLSHACHQNKRCRSTLHAVACRESEIAAADREDMAEMVGASEAER